MINSIDLKKIWKVKKASIFGHIMLSKNMLARGGSDGSQRSFQVLTEHTHQRWIFDLSEACIRRMLKIYFCTLFFLKRFSKSIINGKFIMSKEKN